MNMDKGNNVTSRMVTDLRPDITDSEEINFIYDDTDVLKNEIAEWYAYPEESDLNLCFAAFVDKMLEYGFDINWHTYTIDQKKSVIMRLLNELDISDGSVRMKAARCLLYIAQGCWNVMMTPEEQLAHMKNNVMLLHNFGIFSAFFTLLNLELDNNKSNFASSEITVRSSYLRIILSGIYMIIEVMRVEKHSSDTVFEKEVAEFVDELQGPKEHFVVSLLNMLLQCSSNFVLQSSVKKIVLLIWKTLLLILGGSSTLTRFKSLCRTRVGLPEFEDDTLEIVKRMEPAHFISYDLKSKMKIIYRSKRKSSNLPKDIGNKNNSKVPKTQLAQNVSDKINVSDVSSQVPSVEENKLQSQQSSQNVCGFKNKVVEDCSDKKYKDEESQCEPIEKLKFNKKTETIKCLPCTFLWKPKVSQSTIDKFLSKCRLKYFGMDNVIDSTTVIGFPRPVIESLNVLQQHKYISLTEVQIDSELNIQRSPILHMNTKNPDTPAEILYRELLPNLDQYIGHLLSTMSSAVICKTHYNFLEIFPDLKQLDNMQETLLSIDSDRHHEIILKAISGIIMLLLKHFKLNHVCQFEYLARCFIMYNLDLFIVNFFKKNMLNFVILRNEISSKMFPLNFFNSSENIHRKYSWRNMFSSINLLRILNKLNKRKPSRITSIVLYNSAEVLKQSLVICQPMFQLYILKLLKMQARYLGKRWRKMNMGIITEIYTKVRHRLIEEWAYGDDLKPYYLPLSEKEHFMNILVDNFNKRRYMNSRPSDFEESDNNLVSVLNTDLALSNDFKDSYETWLKQELYNSN